jgi:hypothetical protein
MGGYPFLKNEVRWIDHTVSEVDKFYALNRLWLLSDATVEDTDRLAHLTVYGLVEKSRQNGGSLYHRLIII